MIENARPRVFHVWTDHGSRFAFKLEPKVWFWGVQCGPTDIRGFSRSQEKQLRIVGTGCEPFPGGTITVSDEAYDVVDLGEGPVAFYDTETIVRVREIPVPDAALATPIAGQPA